MVFKVRKNIQKTLIFLSFFATFPAAAQQGGGIGVAIFTVNGPADLQYLSQAAQDAVVGALVKRGKNAHSIPLKLDPDRLHSVSQGKGRDALLVAGRINIVGQTYRVLLQWVDPVGEVKQEYLEVGDINQLLPQLEGFAANRLKVPESSSVATAPQGVSPPAVRAPISVEKPKNEKPIALAVPAPVPPPPPAPVETKPKKSKEEKITVYEEAPRPAVPPVSGKGSKPLTKVLPAPGESYQDYASISQRLPYEVRAMAFGDANGDGQEEILLTGQRDLFAYHFQDGRLSEIGRYSGKPLDNFVKVGIWPNAEGGKTYVVLTNLRGQQAVSEILRFDQGQFSPVAHDIPYQLRVVFRNGSYQLMGEPYSGNASTRHQIYEMTLTGGGVKVGQKVDLPYEIGLFSFEYLSGPNSEFSLASLTPSGNLKLYKEVNGKIKGVWTSRDSYGGSANDVEVNVKDFFNEVVANYYIVPLGLRVLPDRATPTLVVAKNDALLKEIVGRKPVISDGRMVKLQWGAFGMNEAWSSKKVDGSILDYQFNNSGGQLQLMVAVRMRDQGFFEGIGKNKDSVLLVYNLN